MVALLCEVRLLMTSCFLLLAASFCRADFGEMPTREFWLQVQTFRSVCAVGGWIRSRFHILCYPLPSPSPPPANTCSPKIGLGYVAIVAAVAWIPPWVRES